MAGWAAALTKIAPLKKSPNNIGPMVMKPITTDGMASSTSGTVTTQGDSCGCMVGIVVPMVVTMVGVGVLVETLLAVEHQEIHAEGIEGGDEHTRQHGEAVQNRHPADG